MMSRHPHENEHEHGTAGAPVPDSPTLRAVLAARVDGASADGTWMTAGLRDRVRRRRAAKAVAAGATACALVGVVTLGVAAASPWHSSDVVPAVTRTPTPGPSTSTAGAVRLVDGDGAEIAVRWVDAGTAPVAQNGTDYTTVTTVPAVTDGAPCADSTLAQALFDDGAWLASVDPQANCEQQEDGAFAAPQRVGIVPAGGASATTWPSTQGIVPADTPRQAAGATTDGSLVVWRETPSMFVQDDRWRVLAADRPTGAPHLVARSEELAGTTSFDEASGFAVHDDEVLWGVVVGSGADQTAEVLGKALDGSGRLRVVARDAASPVATDQGVVVRAVTTANVSVDDDESTVVSGSQRWYTTVARLDDQGRAHTLVRLAPDGPLTSDQRITSLAGHGSTVTFAVADAVYLLDLRTGEVVGFRDSSVAPVAGMTDTSGATDGTGAEPWISVGTTAVGDELAVWSETSTTPDLDGAAPTLPVLVYDVRTGDLHRVPVSQSSGQVWAAGDHVGWWSGDAGTVAVRWNG